MSCQEIDRAQSLMNAAKMPPSTAPRMAIGSMFTPRPLRRITTNTPKPSAAITASALPSRVPAPNPSHSITPIPTIATPIATHTARSTLSPSTIHPSRAVKNGAALSENMVFATVV